MIRLNSLPLRGAAYHWRNTLPVALGVAVAAAVLTGALVVGDSLRGSLRERSLRQIGEVRSAVVGGRFVRADLLSTDQTRIVLSPTGYVQHDGTTTRPLILLTGSVSYDGRTVSRVNVIGADDNTLFWLGHKPPQPWTAVMGGRLANRLQYRTGEPFSLTVEKSSVVPRSSFLGRRELDESSAALRLTTQLVVWRDRLDEFSLQPNPEPPLNLFVNLSVLSPAIGRAGRVNAFLSDSLDVAGLSAQFASRLDLDDWGLTVRVAPKRDAYVSVESERLILSPAEVTAIEVAAKAVGADSRRTYSYLANAISAGTEKVPNDDPGTGKKLAPYAVVAALDLDAPAPLGPFVMPRPTHMADDEVVLLDWPDSPLAGLKPGDPVTLTFFKPELEAGVEEASRTFRLAGYIPLDGAAADPDLTPPFPGITDKLSIDKWDAPFKINRERIKANDPSERFWKANKATPKAYITTTAGERSFGSRFGSVTSVRVAPPEGTSPEQLVERLKPELLKHLDPAAAGLVFEPVRERLLAASKGGTDFAGLLLVFSWLLIGTALLLVGLLFRLATERRAKEVGLLLASGYSPRLVKRLLLTEGLGVSAVGALVGVGLAVIYAGGAIRVLTALWPDSSVADFLRLHVQPGSLVAGFLVSVVVALVAVWLSLRGLVTVPPPMLLRGETSAASDAAGWSLGGWWLPGLLVPCGVGLAVAGTTRGNPDERSMAFFAGGGLVLVAGLLAVRWWLRASVTRPHSPSALGRRNPGRTPGRSLLTVALIALGVFLVVSVESFRRRPDGDFAEKTGGSGGFRLVADCDVPVFRPFDNGDGRNDLLDLLQAAYQRDTTGNPAERVKAASALLDRVSVVPLRRQDGDDASCLNLYQAGKPRVLGVPDALIDRGGFRFGDTLAETVEEKTNPWLLLRRTFPDGAIPCFAEQNTALFMLKVMKGGTLTVPDEAGNQQKLRLVGLLQDSPFQSEVLIGDAAFRSLYPRTEGFRAFLIDCPPSDTVAVAGLLETGLRANGFVTISTADRVDAYQRVVGAYLTTFQLLGALALLLAVAGLGVVVLRAVWERAGELALLRAIGYTPAAVQAVVRSETLVLLAAGVLVGLVAALAAVLPNLTLGGEVPWLRLAGLLLIVGAVGVGVAAVATDRVSRSPIVPALRRE